MLRLLVVEDDAEYVAELRSQALDRSGRPCEVHVADTAAAAEAAILRFRPDLVLLDMIFPSEAGQKPKLDAGVRVIDFLAARHATARVVALSSHDRDFAVRLLTTHRIADYLFKDASWKELSARIRGHVEATASALDAEVLREEVRAGPAADEFLGEDPAARETLALADQVALSSATVLLLGESGTGKEVLARRIHARSPRAANAFVAVNCGALDEGMARSELFGHVKGAFTGAVSDRRGRFELAHGGTLFLDEVGELVPGNQVRLLRVLEERTVERMGSSDPIECDVRVVAATNRDLQDLVRRGEFREDLFFRLHVFPIVLPPLRQRPRDVPLLARHFLHTVAARMAKHLDGFTDEASSLLSAYSWPGNVRQLRNVVEYAAIMEPSVQITVQSLPALPGLGRAEEPGMAWQQGATYREAMEAYEKDLLSRALRHAEGDTNQASLLLDLPLRTLQGRLTRAGLKAEAFRTPPPPRPSHR